MQHDDIGGLIDLAFRRLEVAKEDLETGYNQYFVYIKLCGLYRILKSIQCNSYLF